MTTALTITAHQGEQRWVIKVNELPQNATHLILELEED